MRFFVYEVEECFDEEKGCVEGGFVVFGMYFGVFICLGFVSSFCVGDFVEEGIEEFVGVFVFIEEDDDLVVVWLEESE